MESFSVIPDRSEIVCNNNAITHSIGINKNTAYWVNILKLFLKI